MIEPQIETIVLVNEYDDLKTEEEIEDESEIKKHVEAFAKELYKNKDVVYDDDEILVFVTREDSRVFRYTVTASVNISWSSDEVELEES